MIAGPSIGKVIWRKPGESLIYSMSDTGGGDEFIIAPFKKNEEIISIKGVISEMDPQSLEDFFSDIPFGHSGTIESTTQDEYKGNVRNAIDAIANGKFEKVVLARRFFIEKKIDMPSLFLHLVETYKNAFVYCFVLENGTCMTGATPETLLEKKDGNITTEALGGTGQTDGYGEKEYLEHRQIVSYINDKLDKLSYTFRHSEPGIKQAGNVSHLSTAFEVKSKSVDEDMQLLHSLHPTSAVCGLPFGPAYEFIDREEKFDRKFYSGYLGIKSASDFSFYVNLRCAEIYANGALLYAGAGINKDSIPESEWMETTHKLDTLLPFIT